MLTLAGVGTSAYAQAQRPCPSQYGVYYKASTGWKVLHQVRSNDSLPKQGDKPSGAAISVTDHRPTFCVRRPVASLGTPDKPAPVVLIRFDPKKDPEPFRNYSEDQVVDAHIGRADEEGLFTISTTSDLPAGEYAILLGSDKNGGYEFVVR